MRIFYTVFKSIVFPVAVFITGCNLSSVKKIKKARVESVIYFLLTDSIKKLASQEFIPYALKNGWIKKGDTLILEAPLRNITLRSADGKEYRTDDSGYIHDIPIEETNIQGARLQDFEKQIILNGGTLLNSPVVTTREGEINLFKYNGVNGESLRFEEEFGESPDCCKNIFQTASRDPMLDSVCLDYNGWMADGINRSKKDPMAYINFIGSDCNIAMLQFNCGLDHKNGGCFVNHGKLTCSVLIGHSTAYHIHDRH
jgi:hypothetical protein